MFTVQALGLKKRGVWFAVGGLDLVALGFKSATFAVVGTKYLSVLWFPAIQISFAKWSFDLNRLSEWCRASGGFPGVFSRGFGDNCALSGGLRMVLERCIR